MDLLKISQFPSSFSLFVEFQKNILTNYHLDNIFFWKFRKHEKIGLFFNKLYGKLM